MREQSDAEGVTASAEGGRRWVQQTFFPPEEVAIAVKIFLAPSEDHFDFDVEVYDPTTRELFGMMAAPRQSTTSVLASLTLAMRRVSDLVFDVIDPEPF